MSDLFDLHVVYGPDIEKILEKLSSLGFRYIGVAFNMGEERRAVEVKRKAREYGLGIFSRVNLIIRDFNQYHRLTSKASGRFDLVCIEYAHLKILKKVNLKRISLLDVCSASPTLAGKISAMKMGLALEFSFSKFFDILKSKNKMMMNRMIRNLMVFDSLNAPIVVSSGAKSKLGVIPPLQMIYSFSAILHKKEVSKKYISTIPQAVTCGLREPFKCYAEGI